MAPVPPSTKEHIVLVAERLFAERGLDGVSLRQIGVAAGNGNHSAVQYHFGSKEQLAQAIFEYRLPRLNERRYALELERRPDDLRGWVECYVLPILEQGEQEGSHYLSFIAMLQQQSRHEVMTSSPPEARATTDRFMDAVRRLLTHLPEPLATHRTVQAITFSVHAAALRERARDTGESVLSFELHVADLLDGLVGFLQAPVSAATVAALRHPHRGSLHGPVLP